MRLIRQQDIVYGNKYLTPQKFSFNSDNVKIQGNFVSLDVSYFFLFKSIQK